MTTKELITELLEHDMNMRIQIAAKGKLYDLDDIWEGEKLILEVACKDCANCKGGDCKKC